MTDPQPTTVGSKDIQIIDVKMDIDVNNKPAVSSLSPDVSPPSSAAATGVKSVLDKNGSLSSALKNGSPSTDKAASTATGNTQTLSQDKNNSNGDSEKEKGSIPKPTIKIKPSAKKSASSTNDGKKKSSSSSTTTTTKPSLKKTSSSNSTGSSYSGVGGGGGMQRSKAYQGNLRSAAAAHRKDKVAIPPIGSPGLLMMPNPALTANFPKDIQTPEELKQWLYNGQYLLPATVFRRAMEVGGYTAQQRKDHPHRGSSTERQVGDMFDSDVGGLYLHFPELIPSRVWERRLGGELDDYTNDDAADYMDDFPVRDRRKRRRKSSSTTSSKRRGSHSSDTNTKSDGGGSNNNNNKSKDHHSGVKGARSSYIFFTHEMRPKMMQEFPGMKFTEQGIIMGERWRALTPEQKKPYEDLANEDKKRYATEWAAYLETVKKEIREEKEGGGKNNKKEDDGETTKEEVEDDDEEDEEDDDDEEEDSKPVVVKPATVRKKGNESAIKGPRLVDAVILSLCNILGEKAYRTEPLPPMPQKNKESVPPAAAVANDSKPVTAASLEAPSSNGDIVPTADISKSDPKPIVPEQSKSDSNIVKPANPDPVTSSGTNVAAATDGTKETISHPSKDLALEELPKLNPALPQTRKRCRPHEPMSFLDMIPTSLTCTYPQEYVAKRRAYAEAVRAREEAIIASQEAKDDADDAREKYLAHTEAWDRMLEYQKQQIAKRAAERKRQKARKEAEENKNGDKDNGDAETGNDTSNKEVVEKEEDPMECMPPRPKSPPPARVVSIPDIPTPPSPPQLFEIDDDDMDTDNNTTSIRVPKKKTELLQHLDPKCFIPNMDGRYFGLISNSIADPQFVGPTSTGIRGTTFGGGTGLATSYVGGGRGASGLVSGPSRSSVGSRASSTVLAMEEDAKTSASVSDGTSTKVSSKKKKRSASSPPSSSSSSSKKRDKKETKKLCLATGDRITSATEVSSGPAGPEFPSGWVIKTYRRSGGETIGKTDRFWFSPGRNIRFRAKKHAKQFIDILNEPSINGDEDAAAEAYKKRGLHF